MKRPLCLFCLTFVAVLVLCVQFVRAPIPDYGGWDGQHLILEGHVYQKEHRVFNKNNIQEDVLVIYLKSIQILSDSGNSLEIPQNQIQNVMCYMEDGMEPAIGSLVRIEGEVGCFDEATNPGEFDMRQYYRILKLDFRLYNAELKAYSLEHDALKEKLYRLKNECAEILDYCFDEKYASVMKAILLGEKSSLDKETKQLYQQSGIIHILAISGLHISIIGMSLYKLLRKGGIPVKICAPVSIAVIWCYGIMTGMNTSSMRAIFMFILHLTAHMIGRTYDMLTAVSLAAVLLLLEQPMYIVHSGFLFSFGAIVAIGVFLPVLYAGQAGNKRNKRNKIMLKVRQASASGAAIALVTLPVHLTFYYQFPVYSILLNLLIIPLMNVVMCDGLLCMLAGSVFPVLAKYAARINIMILWFYEKCCLLSLQLPGGNMIAGQPEKWQIAVYVIMLAVLPVINKKVAWLWKGQWLVLAVLILTLRTQEGLSVTIIDVGQGDGIHIRSDTGNHYLIDGGSSTKNEVGTYQLAPYLKSQGVSRLKAVFITHADADHCNGAKTLFMESGTQGIVVESLILPDIAEGSKDEAYIELTRLAEEKGIAVKYMSRGQYIRDGEMCLTCIHPFVGYSTDEANEYSLVLYLTYGKFSGLFTGDVEGEGEAELKRYMREINGVGKDLTFLKVAHHGSNNSTDEELLRVLNPETAFISCGIKNRYGHPHQELLQRLEQSGCKVYITQNTGAVTITTDGKERRIRTFK